MCQSKNEARDRLHEELDTLYDVANGQRMLLHALIDAGRVTEFACQYEGCEYGDRRFWGSMHGRTRLNAQLGIAVDHITSWRSGGSHRPENLQLVHWGCNGRKAMIEDAWLRSEVVAEAKAADREEDRERLEKRFGQWPMPVTVRRA